MINVHTQVINGRTIALAFDVQAWVDVEEHFGGIAEMEEKLERLDARFALLEIMARGGARKRPELPGKLDRDWLINNATPHEVMELYKAAKVNMIANFRGEEVRKDEKPVDVVLEELKAKNARS